MGKLYDIIVKGIVWNQEDSLLLLLDVSVAERLFCCVLMRSPTRRENSDTPWSSALSVNPEESPEEWEPRRSQSAHKSKLSSSLSTWTTWCPPGTHQLKLYFRYRFDEAAVKDIRERVQEDGLKSAETRTTVRTNLSKYLTERYRNLPALNLVDKKGQSRFLFTKLRFWANCKEYKSTVY